jgi:DNA polymerase
VDARDRLRRYLEQRRELGESEFVLDSLPVEEALRALGLQGELPGELPGARAPAAHAPPESASSERTPAPGTDWRSALRSVGVDQPGQKEEPAEKIGRYDMPKLKASDSPAEAKPGIVTGDPGSSREKGELSTLHSLGAIAKAVETCTACPLYSTAKNPVPGEGSPTAEFVCVGEAPGATEDEMGRPFVGASGQLLTKILAAVKFAREDVFICNVIKHRPPGNRNPTAEEIAACSPYLLRQLELLKPRVILTLGTFAAQTLLQTTQPIGKLRGQIHRFYGVPLIVTYHPAALLRNPSWKRSTWEDVQLARRVFDSAASGA